MCNLDFLSCYWQWAMIIYVVRLRPVSLVIFCGGFAAAALEVVLLLAFQVLFGSLYYQVGWVITMFMLGLVIGTFYDRSVLALLGTASHGRFGCCHCPAGHWFAIRVGSIGGNRNRPRSAKRESRCLPYCWLFWWAWNFHWPHESTFRMRRPPRPSFTRPTIWVRRWGALLVSTLLIPILGVFMVCLLTAGLNLVAGAMMLVRRN